MYVIIDNYDSFTHNLYQYLCELTEDTVEVFRNDRITVDEMAAMNPTGIVISPGPGRPEEAGISVECIQRLGGHGPHPRRMPGPPGHRLRLRRAGSSPRARIVHGKTEEMSPGRPRAFPRPAAHRAVHPLPLPGHRAASHCRRSWRSPRSAPDGEIMGVRHRTHVVEGVQFHPESIASETGKRCLRNFLRYRREPFPLSAVLRACSGKGHGPGAGGGVHGRADRRPAHRRPDRGGACVPHGEAHHAGDAGGIRHRAAAQEEAVRQRPQGAGHLRDREATAWARSTSPPWRPSSRHPAAPSSRSTATGRQAPRAEARISTASWASPWMFRPQPASSCCATTGFCFLFAPTYHGAMRHAARARSELGIKSAMNLVGPLSNPADASYQLIGVFDPAFCGPVAEAAHLLGVRRVMAVHGEDGLDEISVAARTLVVEVDETGARRDYILTPEEFGITRSPVDALKGGTAAQNAATALAILDGGGPEAVREAVLLNAGAALYICGIARNIGDGYLRARGRPWNPEKRGALLRGSGANPWRGPRTAEGQRRMTIVEKIVAPQEGTGGAGRALARRARARRPRRPAGELRQRTRSWSARSSAARRRGETSRRTWTWWSRRGPTRARACAASPS